MILGVVCRYLSLFLLYINIKKGSIDLLDKPVTTLWEVAGHLAVASGVFDDVFSCCLFPTGCLG